MERNWKRLENLRGVEVTIGNGSNARSRGECQADGTDDVRYMVFLLKIVGEIGKILKDINKCLNSC